MLGKLLLGNIGLDNIFGGKDDNSWLVIALVVIVVIALLSRDKKKEFC
ncbi:MAG: hypothetical protein ACOX3Q_13365 [Clostridia bacterium]|jgi:hypothetical protein